MKRVGSSFENMPWYIHAIIGGVASWFITSAIPILDSRSFAIMFVLITVGIAALSFILKIPNFVVMGILLLVEAVASIHGNRADRRRAKKMDVMKSELAKKTKDVILLEYSRLETAGVIRRSWSKEKIINTVAIEESMKG